MVRAGIVSAVHAGMVLRTFRVSRLVCRLNNHTHTGSMQSHPRPPDVHPTDRPNAPQECRTSENKEHTWSGRCKRPQRARKAPMFCYFLRIALISSIQVSAILHLLERSRAK
jgi:hypothetical protein